jgi:hypothetical protein
MVLHEARDEEEVASNEEQPTLTMMWNRKGDGYQG